MGKPLHITFKNYRPLTVLSRQIQRRLTVSTFTARRHNLQERAITLR